MTKRYHVKYDFQHSEKGWTKKELEKEDWGGCTAVVVCSIVREGKEAHDGGTSHVFLSMDGQNGGLSIPTSELFSVFCSMAHYFKDRNEEHKQETGAPLLKDYQKDIIDYVVSKATENILKGKGW